MTSFAGIFVVTLLWVFSSSQASKVLLIIGNSNGKTLAGGFSTGDRFLRDRLQSTLGHTVQVVPDSASKDSIVRSAGKSDLVVVLESVTSTLLLDKLKAVPEPVLNFEAFIQDDMGMTALGPSGDPGAPDQFAFGVMANSDRISIQKPTHPLAAGFSGQVKVYSQLKQITWGKVGPGAEVIATLISDNSGAAIYLYPKGAKLFDLTIAAGMRLGFFLEDDNVAGTPNLMTSEGLSLFDRAVAFALTNGVVKVLAKPRQGRLVSTLPKADKQMPVRDARGRRLKMSPKIRSVKDPFFEAADRVNP